MLEAIKRLLSDGAGTETDRTDPLQVAAAALLVEVASQDSNFDADERRVAERLLRRFFKLDAGEALSLLEKGEAAAEEAVQLHRFVTELNRGLSPESRGQLIEMLWEVAYADGHVDAYEDSLLRRIAGLLGVSDFDRGEARKRVLARRAGGSGTPADPTE
jgi:uncharacterized tellurite resistance protein B-like protein